MTRTIIFPDISTAKLPALLPWPLAADFEVVTDNDGKRHYRYQGGPWLVSSTTALGIIAKGYAFESWIAQSERDKYDLAIAETVLEPVAPEFLLATVKQKVGKRLVYTTIRDTAADDGTAVHAAVRAFLAAELAHSAPPIPKLSADGLVAFSTFVGWWRESGLVPLVMEQPLSEPEWGYSGTLDIAACRPDGTVIIVDLKKTKWVSNGYHYQLASYIRAARQYADVQGGMIVKLPKGGRPLEIVQLGEKMWGGDRTEADCMRAFRHALELWRCENPR